MDAELHTMLAALPADAQVDLLHKVAEWAQRKDPAGFADVVDDYTAASRFRDYLTAEEAALVVDSFTNFDGSRGARWSPDTFFRKIGELGGSAEREGHYNRYAAYAVTAMIWSDYGGVLRSLVDDGRMLRVCWQMAQALLDDKDRPEGHSVRWYFGVDADN